MDFFEKLEKDFNKKIKSGVITLDFYHKEYRLSVPDVLKEGRLILIPNDNGGVKVEVSDLRKLSEKKLLTLKSNVEYHENTLRNLEERNDEYCNIVIEGEMEKFGLKIGCREDLEDIKHLSKQSDVIRESQDHATFYESFLNQYKCKISIALKKINKKKKKIEKEKLKTEEQLIFDLELEKQRLAQEHELAKMDKLLQIEEMKLIREREQRQAEQDQIDSLKDSIRQS